MPAGDYFLRVPFTPSPSAVCAQYLLQIGGSNVAAEVEVEGDVPSGDPAVVDRLKGKAVATRLVEVMGWLSTSKHHAGTASAELLALCGGNDALDRRKVVRGVKRVLAWERDWSDHDTPPQVQMSGALSKQIIFDKLIRRKNLRYIVDTSTQEQLSGRGVFLSVADVALCCLLCPWLTAFASSQDYLLSTIPSVVRYVQHILRELEALHRRMNIADPVLFRFLVGELRPGQGASASASSVCGGDCGGLASSWVMRANLSGEGSTPFRAKHLPGPRAVISSTNTNMTISSSLPQQDQLQHHERQREESQQEKEGLDRSDEEFNTLVDRLIALVDWPRDATHEEGEEEGEGGSQDALCAAVAAALVVDCGDCSDSGAEGGVAPHLDCCGASFWEQLQLPSRRRVRKQAQVLSLLGPALALLPPGGTAVEFCCGGGYVGLALAALRPDARVLLTDMNSVSLAFARERVQRLGLQNVSFLRCELADWEQQGQGQGQGQGLCRVAAFSQGLPAFELGLALHACGTATDVVGQICARAGASFVLSPCCYGFIQHAAQLLSSEVRGGECGCGDEGTLAATCALLCSTPEAETGSANSQAPSAAPLSASTTSISCSCAPVPLYPLSARFREAGWAPRWYPRLCRAADRTFWGHDARAAAFNPAGRRAMRLVDSDRLLHFAAAGYSVRATYMRPRDASPKNHVLVGAAPGRQLPS